ncbi:MAG: hypothetical protein IPM54_37085 [Polyangiaceae bacterium]|nr:hypothetical protein [Polyangiaceae bacterium]
MRRFDFGLGALLGMGARPAQWLGPLLSLGIVPWLRVPHLRMEIDVAYALPMSDASRSNMIPLFGSLCYVPSALRLCTGVVTTFFLSEPGNDAMHTTLAASMRLGAEFEIAGPASIRIDGFALVPLGERSFGSELSTRDAQDALMAGTSVTGVWSFE